MRKPRLKLTENPMRLVDALPLLAPADLLLFKLPGILSRVIRRYGRSEFSHAAMLDMTPAWQWRAVEMTAPRGRQEPLDRYVVKKPGAIHVFKAVALQPPGTDGIREACVGVMRQLCLGEDGKGVRYGYRDLARDWMLRRPVLRWLLPDPQDDDCDDVPLHCSGTYVKAYRRGSGRDPCPNLADWATEPADLARSLDFKYLCTLIP
jgi:hypothetical protein